MASNDTAITFLVRKNDLAQTRLRHAPAAPLAAGQARLRIGSFALTANNITYARFGDAMRYWDFFPTGEAGWGCIPVWGFAHVAESRCEGLPVGEKLYGYFPMASEVVIEPARMRPKSLVDAAPHRADLPAVYNQLTRCEADVFHKNTAGGEFAREDVQSLMRPLFITSFLIDDFLADNAFFGAGSPSGEGATLLLSSASSKTAYGTAFQLAQRSGLRTVGLTSKGNVPFCESLGCYDRVVAYDNLNELDADASCVYIDFAGNADLRGAVHGRFPNLKYSCSVGGTQFEARTGSDRASSLPGPKATLFFASAQIKKRSAEWGAAEMEVRLLKAWQGFTARIVQPPEPWLVIERHAGAEAIAAVYQAQLAGRADPRTGHIIALA
jgi:hypothetical protein